MCQSPSLRHGYDIPAGRLMEEISGTGDSAQHLVLQPSVNNPPLLVMIRQHYLDSPNPM